MSKLNRLFIILMLVCVISMSACQQQKNAALFDQSTPLPGWRGIIPGETSIDDAIRLINNMPDLDMESGCSNQYEYHG